MKKICYITTVSITVRAFLFPQLKYLAKNGYDVTVICSPDDRLQDELGPTVQYLPVKIVRGISLFTLKKTILDLKKIFEANHYDIVQYLTPNASFVASIAAKMAKVKIRNYYQVGFRYLGATGLLRKALRWIEKITCDNSTHIECVSRSNIELGIKEGFFTRDKVYMIWNGSAGGIDLARFDITKRTHWRDEIRAELSCAENDLVFGFVGRVTKDKGINEILEAFQSVESKSKLLLIGEKEGVDTLNPHLWEYAQKNENILIHDSVSDIERYYAAIDVLLLPSYREGFGMVIAEAAAVGTPAIVSRIPGPVDAILENKTAFTVEVKNAEDLKNKMELFIKNPQLCKDMGQECVRFIADSFDNRIFCEKVLERKDSLLN